MKAHIGDSCSSSRSELSKACVSPQTPRTNWPQLVIADGVGVARKSRKQPRNLSDARLTIVITIPTLRQATAYVHPAVRHFISMSFNLYRNRKAAYAAFKHAAEQDCSVTKLKQHTSLPVVSRTKKSQAYLVNTAICAKLFLRSTSSCSQWCSNASMAA